MRTSRASATGIFLGFFDLGIALLSISLIFIPRSSIPIGPNTCIPEIVSCSISISIIVSSKSPFSNFFLNLLLVLELLSFDSSDNEEPFFLFSGKRISIILSLARLSANSITSSSFSLCTILKDVSIKSLIMDSTSLPT